MTAVEKQLALIRTKIAAMGGTAADMFQQAALALTRPDEQAAREVVARDALVDALEVEIEGVCLKYLALQAPKALELRYAVAATRLTLDIERVADHATVLCREFLGRPIAGIVAAHPDFSTMAALAGGMVRRAVDGFLALDDSLYLGLNLEDKEVGALQRAINRSLAGRMAENTERALDYVAVINIVRRVERVADHAKNIAVMIPYVTKGLLLRHKTEDGADADHDD